MRTTAANRLITGLAALGLSVGVLASAPASADPSSPPASGITRAQVLEAAALARQAIRDDNAYASLNALVHQVCGVPSGQNLLRLSAYWEVVPVATSSSVDGVLVSAGVSTYRADDSFASAQNCTVAVLAATDEARTMNGTVKVTSPGVEVETFALNEQVFVSPLVGAINSGRAFTGSMTASGTVDQTLKVPIKIKVVTPTSAARKKAARRAYDKSLAAAKNSYKKAVKKAGKSKSAKVKAKKLKAKKAYNRRKVSAAKTYRGAIASSVKYVPSTRTTVDRKPFTVTAVQSDNRL